MLGIPIFQLKTKHKRITQKSQNKKKKNKNKTKQKKKNPNKTTTTQISINNLKMGPRAYIGHKLQI